MTYMFISQGIYKRVYTNHPARGRPFAQNDEHERENKIPAATTLPSVRPRKGSFGGNRPECRLPGNSRKDGVQAQAVPKVLCVSPDQRRLGVPVSGIGQHDDRGTGVVRFSSSVMLGGMPE